MLRRRPPRPTTLEPVCRVENATKLVVVVRGLGKSFFIKDVLAAIGDACPNADITTLRYNSGIWSNQSAPELISILAQGIGEIYDRKSESGKPYESVSLVGHSIGSLLVRGAFLLGNGYKFTSTTQVPGSSSWCKKVDRIISLAGLNKGWQYPKVGPLRSVLLRAIRFYADAFNQARFMLSVAEGAPFIVDLRLHWWEWVRAAAQSASRGEVVPATSHIRGERDDLVKSEDLEDLLGAPDFKGRLIKNVAHFNIGIFTHETAKAVKEEYSKKPTFWGCIFHPIESSKQYLKIFAFAWLLEDDTGAPGISLQERRDELFDALGPRTRGNQDGTPPIMNTAVRKVVMIKHGIRDSASGWANSLIKEIGSQASAGTVIATAAGYQRFSMFQFLIPGARVARVRLMMKEYTDLRVAYPSASFCYFGHSYGTYLLCRALRDYQSCRFEHAVVLAGSVVCTDFGWQAVLDSRRVNRVKNIRANGDLTVSVFPGSFEKLRNLFAMKPTRWSDILGYAGVDGFNLATAGGGQYFMNVLFRGGHGTALKDERHSAIARFLLGDDAAITDDANESGKTVKVRWLTTVASTLSFVIFGALVFALGREALLAYASYGPLGFLVVLLAVILLLTIV
jgi:hypothetical protein